MNYSSLLQDVLIPAGLKLGGYPDDVFVNMTEKEREEFECQICYMVLKDARQCDNHHYFCAPCIFSWSIGHGENHDKCPVCRTDSAYKTCPEIDERLSRKRVRCIQPKCEWRGFLRDFRSHDHGLELVGGRSEEILPEVIAQLPQHRPPTPPSFFFGVPLVPSHDNMLAHAAAGGRGPRYQQMRSHLEEGRDRLLALMLTFSEVLDMRRRNILQFHNHRENNRVQQMQEVHHLGERLGDVATALMFLLEEARTDMNQMHDDFRNLPDIPAGLHPLSTGESEASTPRRTQSTARTPVSHNTGVQGAQSLRAAFNPSLSHVTTRTSSFPLIGNMTPNSDVSSPRSSDGASTILESSSGVTRSLASGVNSSRFTDTASRISVAPVRTTSSSLGTISDRILDTTPRSRTSTSLSLAENDSGPEEEEVPHMSTRASISRYRRRMIRRQLGDRSPNVLAQSTQPLPQINSPTVPVSLAPLPAPQVLPTSSQPAPAPTNVVSSTNTIASSSTSETSPEGRTQGRDWGTFTVSASYPNSVTSDNGERNSLQADGGASAAVDGNFVASSGIGTSSSTVQGRRAAGSSAQRSDLNRSDGNSLTVVVSTANRPSGRASSASATTNSASTAPTVVTSSTTASRLVYSSANPITSTSSRPPAPGGRRTLPGSVLTSSEGQTLGTTARLLNRNQESNSGLIQRENTESSENTVSMRAAVRRPSGAGISRPRPPVESSPSAAAGLPRRTVNGSTNVGAQRNVAQSSSNGVRRPNVDNLPRAGLHRRTNNDLNNSNNNLTRRLSTDAPSLGTVTRRRTNNESRRLSLDMNPNPNRRISVVPGNTVSRTARRASNDNRISGKSTQSSGNPNNS